MTAPHPGLPETSPDVAGELALEQAHVDRVYAELEKASRRAADVEADGMARGRTSRTGDVRDEALWEEAAPRLIGIDHAVVNAGVSGAGPLAELTLEDWRRITSVNLDGAFLTLRAAMRAMRGRGGSIVAVASASGLKAEPGIAAYAASKFALEGWMESLHFDIAPYGISTTLVEPGFFRTELLVEGASAIWPELSIPDYADRTAQTIEGWKAMNGRQGGDPAKLAHALLTITGQEQPPFRFIAGADALAQAEAKLAERRQQIDAYRELSSSLALDEVTA